MARALAIFECKDSAGNVRSTSTVRIYETNGTTPIAASLYAAASGGSPMTQPLSPNASGVLYVYIDAPQDATASIDSATPVPFRFDIDDTTVVTRTGVETLTNKTLTAPTITGGTQASPTISAPTVANPLYSAGAEITLDAFIQAGDNGNISLALNRAAAVLAVAGGTLRCLQDRYIMKSRANFSDLCGFEILGASVSSSTATNPTTLVGTHFEFDAAGGMDGLVAFNFAGSTQFAVRNIQIGISSDTATTQGSYYGATPSDMPLCGIAIAGQSGKPSEHITLESVYVSGSYQKAGIWAYGVSDLKFVATKGYNYNHQNSASGIFIDATNAANITGSDLDGITLNSGYAETFSIDFLAGSQAHDPYYDGNNVGTSGAYALRLNRAKSVRLHGLDAVSSNALIFINDESATGNYDGSRDISILTSELHSPNVVKPEAGYTGAAAQNYSDPATAILVGPNTTVTNLAIYGLTTDVANRVIYLSAGAQLVNPIIEGVRSWKHAGIPLIESANMAGATAIVGGRIDASGMAVTLTNAAISTNTDICNTSGVTAPVAQQALTRSTQGTIGKISNVAAAMLDFVQQAANTCLQVTAPAASAALRAVTGDIVAVAGNITATAGYLKAAAIAAGTPVANAIYAESGLKGYAVFTLRGTNGSCTIAEALNFSDWSRTGVGDYTGTLRRNMATSTYPVNATLKTDTAGVYHVRVTASTTSQSVIRIIITDGASTPVDPSGTVQMMVFVGGTQ